MGLPRGAIRLDYALGLARCGQHGAAAGQQPRLIECIHRRVHGPEELHLVQGRAAEPRDATCRAGRDGGEGVPGIRSPSATGR